MDVTADQLATGVATLVRIPSVNPLQAGPKSLAAGPIGERALAEHLAHRFRELGAAEVVLDEVLDNRPNVYGLFPGRSDRLVVVDVHTDTVTVEHMTDQPFDGRIEGGFVWGRGALDTKATLGVLLVMLEDWQSRALRPEPNLLVVGSVSEESGGLLGAARFRQWATERELDIDQTIIAEPTELAPIHGHKGGVSLRVSTLGKAAHSALPQLGLNAIEAMAPVIAAIESEHQRLQTLEPTTELGTATVSVTLINGGTGGNVIPAKCSIVVGYRTVPGEVGHDVYERLASIAQGASPLPTRITPLQSTDADGRIGGEAFYQQADTPLATTLSELAGTSAQVAPFGTNALQYNGFGGQLAVFGPGAIDDAHQATERVSINDLVKTAEIYTSWLNPA